MKDFVLVHVRVKNEPNSVLLVLKDRPEHLKGRFNLVGGKIEEGELPSEAAYRELKEETGIDLDDKQFHMSGIINGADNTSGGKGPYKIYCFYVDVDTVQFVTPQIGETEIFEWHDYQIILKDKRLMPNLRVTIPLMAMGVRGWVIDDLKPMSGETHEIQIRVKNGTN